MSLKAAPSMSLSRRGPTCLGSDPLRTIVWVRGEQDIANRMHLSTTIAQAARLDDAHIVVDLSGVTFMDASTIAVLVVARNRLGAPSRSLSVCDPSPRARRLLEVCGLTQLIDQRPAPVATALDSWIHVPASDGGPDSERPQVTHEAPPEPAGVTVRRRLELVGSVQSRRAAS